MTQMPKKIEKRTLSLVVKSMINTRIGPRSEGFGRGNGATREEEGRGGSEVAARREGGERERRPVEFHFGVQRDGGGRAPAL